MVGVAENISTQIVQKLVELCKTSTIKVLCQVLDDENCLIFHRFVLRLVEFKKSQRRRLHDSVEHVLLHCVLDAIRRSQDLVNGWVVCILAYLVTDAYVGRRWTIQLRLGFIPG